VDADAFLAWVDDYERAWRSPGTEALAQVFAEDATYLHSPYSEPTRGLPAIARMWESEREAPDEVFTMRRELVAFSGETGVARVEVRYGEPVRQEYRDLWVVRFGPDGRARHFEEWPFWPGRSYSPAHGSPVVLEAAELPAEPYAEWVRVDALSAGVYRLPAGGADEQSPHAEDEVYVVTRGNAILQVGGRGTPVRPGSVAYVPARVEHRFARITEDLEVVVVFAPAESG
jgi:mannose-6-phosphate isomerase-like protein (cupin superfamily)